MPYLGYVEAHLKIPQIKAFDFDVLLLIVLDSAIHPNHIRNITHRHGNQISY